MRHDQEEIKKFTHKGRKFSKSMHHKDMWIVDNGPDVKTGVKTFHTLYASQAEIIAMFPPDPPKVKQRHIIATRNGRPLNRA